MITQIGFNDEGVGCTIFAAPALQEGRFLLPMGASNVSARYRLGEEGPVDAYPGLTDDEVLAALATEEAERAAALAATKRAGRKLTPLEFYSMFTATELNAIYTAAAVDPRAKVYLDKVQMAQDISLSDPRTVEGIGALVDLRLLTQARATAILSGNLPE